VTDPTGREIDHGEMVRHLREMMSFPSALLEDDVTFEAVEARSARVILTDHGRTATGTLLFDADGRPWTAQQVSCSHRFLSPAICELLRRRAFFSKRHCRAFYD
jgi:hypothetical protein